jgi:hypothetical protein
VFQLAGALTLQHYLNTMSKQLEALQRGVQDVKDMLVQAQKGDLYAAQRFAVQQEQLVADGTKLGVDHSSAIEGPPRQRPLRLFRRSRQSSRQSRGRGPARG